jgi:hypothetical protein
MKMTRLRALVALSAAGAVVAVTGTALAIEVAEADDGAIHACRHPNGGWVRIVTAETRCRPREQAVSWNVQGAKGDPGPEGPPGPKGDPGAGLTGLGDLDGIPCTADGDKEGKVELDHAGDDTVLIRCVAGGSPPPPPPPPSTSLVINEVDYDQVGADSDGFVEVKNVGDSAADLAGITLVFVDGADSTEYDRKALSGTIAAGDYVAVDAEAQNGAPDGLALVHASSGALLDALSYEGPITSATIDGSTYDLVEGTALPATVADSNTVDGSLSRIPDGRDTNDASADWAFTTTRTRGAENVLSAR